MLIIRLLGYNVRNLTGAKKYDEIISVQAGLSFRGSIDSVRIADKYILNRDKPLFAGAVRFRIYKEEDFSVEGVYFTRFKLCWLRR